MPDERQPNPETIPVFFQNVRLQTALLFGAAFLLYANSLTHGFVLDDNALIAQNAFTTKGFEGLPGIFSTDMFYGLAQSDVAKELVAGGRYRPLSQAMFAVIFQFFGAEPFAYHLVAVLLYALTCAVLYRTVLRLFGRQGYGQLLAWIASLLFVVHPIHTEVVNNVKSCDETLALLFSLLALKFSLRAFEGKNWKWALAAGLAFLLACFSKENAVVFTVLIPLAIWMKMDETSRAENPWAAIAKICLPAWTAFLVFFIVRGIVLGWTFGAEQLNVINNPFVKYTGERWVFFSPSERFATIFYTMGKYVQLLFFPHPLTTDYYPRHIGIKTFTDWKVWLSIAANALPLAYAVLSLIKGKVGPVAFGILFYFLSIFLVSNILFPTGVNMAERFVFMPSVGFCLAVAGLLCFAISRLGGLRLWLAAFCAVCLAFAARAFVRNFDFADSKTLLFKDIKVSANSAKGQCTVGGILLRESLEEKDSLKMREQTKQAIAHFDRALAFHPTYSEAFFARGTAHYFLKNYPAAIEDLRKCAMISPGRPEVLRNLAAALFELGKEILEKNGDPNLAIQYLLYANQVFPNNPETLHYLGLAYAKAGDQAKSDEINRLLNNAGTKQQ